MPRNLGETCITRYDHTHCTIAAHHRVPPHCACPCPSLSVLSPVPEISSCAHVLRCENSEGIDDLSRSLNAEHIRRRTD
jgi:hypothetical protein